MRRRKSKRVYAKARRPKEKGVPNSLELRHYKEEIEAGLRSGEIVKATYEHETFKLADRTTYTPDWNVLRADGIKEQREVKGAIWLGDSRVKFKIAAKMYPEYVWKAYVYKGKNPPEVEEL